MNSDNGLGFYDNRDCDLSKKKKVLKLCCGLLDWKNAVLLIALADVLSISLGVYSTSGSTLGELETRLVISQIFNITINEDKGSILTFSSIYVLGILLCLLRLGTVLFLVLGSQNYRPCNVFVWILSAPVGWILFFIMQLLLMMRYHGVDNQASRLWRIWNSKNLQQQNATIEETIDGVRQWGSNTSSFGQPCLNILIIGIVTFVFTLLSMIFVIRFYLKQKSNEIR